MRHGGTLRNIQGYGTYSTAGQSRLQTKTQGFKQGQCYCQVVGMQDRTHLQMQCCLGGRAE